MDESLEKKKLEKMGEKKKDTTDYRIQKRDSFSSGDLSSIERSRGVGCVGGCIAPSEVANYWNKTFWPRANVESSLIDRGAVSSCWFDDRVPRTRIPAPTRVEWANERSEDSKAAKAFFSPYRSIFRQLTMLFRRETVTSHVGGNRRDSESVGRVIGR